MRIFLDANILLLATRSDSAVHLLLERLVKYGVGAFRILAIGMLVLLIAVPPAWALSPDEATRYRALILDPVPVDITYASQREAFRERIEAAEILGDRAAHINLLESWLSREKDPREALTVKWRLRAAHFEHGNRRRSYELGEEVIRETPFAVERVLMSGYLSRSYLLGWETEPLARLSRIIDINLSEVSNRTTPFFRARMETVVSSVKSQWLLQQGKLNDAIKEADTSMRLARELLSITPPNATQARNAISDAWNTMAYSALVFTDAGQFDKASEGVQAVFDPALSVAYRPYTPLNYVLAAYVANSRGDDALALHYLEKVKQLPSRDLSRNVTGYLHRVEIYSLLGLKRDREADALLTGILVKARSPATGRPTLSQTLGYVLTKFLVGDYVSTETQVRRVRQESAEDPRTTALFSGILAAAMFGQQGWRNRASEIAAGFSDWSQARQRIGLDFAMGQHSVYRRAEALVVDSYLRFLLETQPGANAGEVGFDIGNRLVSPAMQQSVLAAAARSVPRHPVAAELMRSLQDSAGEAKALRSFLTSQRLTEPQRQVTEVQRKMNERLVALDALRESTLRKIEAVEPNYAELIAPRDVSVGQIQKELATGEAFVLLLPTERSVFVWVIDRQSAMLHRADLDAEQLANLVRRMRSSLDVLGSGRGPTDFDASAATSLYTSLLGAAAKQVESARHLVIASGGTLGQIPFSVLLTDAWQGGDPSKAPWLIRKAAVSHVANASAWLALRRSGAEPRAAEPFLGWADPLFNTSKAVLPLASARSLEVTRQVAFDLEKNNRRGVAYGEIPALPETREELQAIARSLKAQPSTDVIFGRAATRNSVLEASKSGLLSRKRVLAFATHGLVPGDLPFVDQPALAMAATGEEQTDPAAALLTLEDVLSLRLNADWVVLSACNTAAADGKGGEALSGLARGFFYAGSRSLLVTHWAVETESAKLLTTSTFEHYAANPDSPKAESLRQAMLQVMADPRYSHPAFWAPYSLVGNGGR